MCDVFDERVALLKAIALRLDQLDRKITICADAMSVRDGQWVYPAGLVLVHQKPGSVVWPSPFQKRRRIVLGSSMMAINSRVKCEGEVVHFVAQQLLDLTGEIRGLADRDEEFKLPAGAAMSLHMAADQIRGTGRSRLSRPICSSLYAELGIRALIPIFMLTRRGSGAGLFTD